MIASRNAECEGAARERRGGEREKEKRRVEIGEKRVFLKTSSSSSSSSSSTSTTTAPALDLSVSLFFFLLCSRFYNDTFSTAPLRPRSTVLFQPQHNHQLLKKGNSSNCRSNLYSISQSTSPSTKKNFHPSSSSSRCRSSSLVSLRLCLQAPQP